MEEGRVSVCCMYGSEVEACCDKIRLDKIVNERENDRFKPLS